MAFAFVDSNLNYSASATALYGYWPAGATTGDIVFALVLRGSSASAPSSTPSGWTLIASDARVTQRPYRSELWYRVKTSGESNPYWNWGIATYTSISTVAYRDGFDLINPISDYSNVEYLTSDATLRASSVAAINGQPIVFAGGIWNPSTTTFTPPSGYAEDFDNGETGSDLYHHFASKISSSDGETGNIDATISASLTTKHAFAVVLAPPAVPTLTNCEDEDIGEDEEGVILDGENLSGSSVTLEIGDASTYGSCVVKTTQTINSNTGSQIDFDVVLGSLDFGQNWLYITVDGTTSDALEINIHQADPVISSLSSGTVEVGDTLIITGSNFGASASSSAVQICPWQTLSGGVSQSVLSWSDTEIQISMVKGSLTFGTRYVVVRRNNTASGDLSNEYDSNFYQVIFQKATVLEYRDIIENGGGRIAHLWHVGGYPWAVTDDAGLIDALSNYGADEVVQAARKRLFGSNTWTCAGFGTVTPAYHVPIFPTLIRDFGNVSWRINEAGGIIDGGNWTVKIEDRDLGHTWDHAVAGDEIWGLDGLHRVANLQDSVVNGWGLLSEKLLRDTGGYVPTQIGVDEQSGQVLYDRVNTLTGDDYVIVWVNHEAIAVDAVDGTFPEYYMDICGLGNLDAGRGLYRSRPQDHHMGRLVGLDPAIADVPGSVIGKYCWLYSIPLTDDDQLRVNGYGEPMIIEELRGVVSPNVSTENNVTTIPIRKEFAAVEHRVSIETSKSVETNLRGFVFTRGDVPSDSLSLIKDRWQQPHLTMCEFLLPFDCYETDTLRNSGNDKFAPPIRTGIFQTPYVEGIPRTHGSTLVYHEGEDPEYMDIWKENYIWLCGKNETVTFETADDVIEALNYELNACYTGAKRNSEETRLVHKWIVDKTPDGKNYYFYTFEDITIEGGVRGITAHASEIMYHLYPYITGPLAWVFNLGIPLNSDINTYTLLKSDPMNGWRKLETTEIVSRSTGDFGCINIPLQNPYNMNGEARYWMHAYKAGSISDSEKSPYAIPYYYYSYPWVDNEVAIPDWTDGTGSVPVIGGTYLPPKSEHDGIRKFYIRNESSPDDWSAGEAFTLGTKSSERRGPLLTGYVDSISESNVFDLVEVVPDTSLYPTPSDTSFTVGYSLFYNPILDGDSDQHAFRKSASAESSYMSHIFRSILGESMSGISIAKEIQISSCPFFTTAGDFVSSIDWDSLDRLRHLGGKFYIPDNKITDNIFDLLKQELLYHSATMTYEYNHDLMMWRFRFRQISAISASDAIQSGLKLSEGKMLPGSPSETNGIGDIYNAIEIEGTNILVTFAGEKYVGSTGRRVLKVSPSITQLPDPKLADRRTSRFLSDTVPVFFFDMLNALSSPTVEQSKGITIMQSLFPVGREILVTDSTARRPFTHSLGLDLQPAIVTALSYNYKKNSGSITYRVGGSRGKGTTSSGYAPACYLDSGNFSKSVGEWSGYPRDHEFTESSQAKDIYFFDCLDLVDINNPTSRDCDCDDYSVWAIEVRTYNWTPLPFTCSVDVSTGVLTLAGDTTNIDESKNYVIVFRSYDDLEDCQKYWVMHADDNNTVGTVAVSANRLA